MQADGWIQTIRNIVWDVDGTLFDTYPAIARAYRAALWELGTDAALTRIQRLAEASLGLCARTLAETLQVDRALLEAAAARHYERTPTDAQPPFPGVRDVCAAIVRSGGRNVIVTHRGPVGTAALLSSNGLDGLFSDSITRADGFARKPDPAAFRAIVERNGLRREETLAIGDRDIDIQAARAAGLRAALFRTSGEPADADLVISDFADLARSLGLDPPE